MSICDYFIIIKRRLPCIKCHITCCRLIVVTNIFSSHAWQTVGVRPMWYGQVCEGNDDSNGEDFENHVGSQELKSKMQTKIITIERFKRLQKVY